MAEDLWPAHGWLKPLHTLTVPDFGTPRIAEVSDGYITFFGTFGDGRKWSTCWRTDDPRLFDMIEPAAGGTPNG